MIYNEQTDVQTDNLREYALTKRGLNKQIELPNIVMRNEFHPNFTCHLSSWAIGESCTYMFK